MRFGQLLHARCRGMEAKLELVEGESAADRDDEFAVDDKLLCFDLAERLNHIREVAGERLSRFGLQIDLIVLAKSDAAKPIPLRFVLPLSLGRDFIDRLRFHRRKRWFD